MDNASIHWSEELRIMCQDANVLLVHLPPYSPDFNPIETSFSILKAWIKRHSSLIDSYTEETGGFGRFLEDALQAISEDVSHDAGALFRQSSIEYNS